MINILITDDHAVVRGGLRQFLEHASDCRIAGEASTGMEALAKLEEKEEKTWDLMLLDIGLPDLNGLEVLKRVKALRPALPVLIFSMFPEDQYAMAALDAGAAGYLPKDSEPQEILDAIRRAASGGRYLSPYLAEKLLAGSMTKSVQQSHELLSPRELAVMRMLSKGMALTDIAKHLCVSPKTVSTYRLRVLEKMGLDNNSDLTRYVIEQKLD